MKNVLALVVLTLLASCTSLKKKQAEKNYQEGIALIEDNLVYNSLDQQFANKAFPLLQKAVTAYPNNAAYHNGLGLAFFHLGDTANANRQFSRALELSAWYTSALVNLGLTHERMGKFDKAIDYYLTARNTDPKNPLIELNIGLLYDGLNDSLTARRHYSRAIALDSTYVFAYHNRAISYHINNRFAEALNDCDKVLRFDSIAVRTRFQKALTLMALTRYEASILEFNHAIRLEPNNHQLYYSRGLAYLYQQDTVTAINDFIKSSELSPTDVTPYLYLASVYYSRSDYHKSLEYANKLLAIQENGPGYYGRAACHQMLGDTVRALADYDKAIEVNKYYDAYLEKAKLLAASGFYLKAVKCLDEVIAQDRTRTEPIILKASLYENAIAEMSEEEKLLNQRHYLWLAYSMDTTNVSVLEMLTSYYAFNVLPPKADSALIFANKWVESVEEKSGALYVRGVCHYFANQFTQSINDLEMASRLDSISYSMPNALGLVYMATKNYDKALYYYNLSLRLNPKYAYAMNNKANTLFASGKKSEACEWWGKAIKTGYQYEAKWKIQYKIDDPVELLKKHCGH